MFIEQTTKLFCMGAQAALPARLRSKRNGFYNRQGASNYTYFSRSRAQQATLPALPAKQFCVLLLCEANLVILTVNSYLLKFIFKFYLTRKVKTDNYINPDIHQTCRFAAISSPFSRH